MHMGQGSPVVQSVAPRRFSGPESARARPITVISACRRRITGFPDDIASRRHQAVIFRDRRAESRIFVFCRFDGGPHEVGIGGDR